MLNRFGLNGHPCRKPFEHKKNCVHLFPSLTADDEFLYMLCIMLRNCPFTRLVLSLSNSPSCHIESYAFFKSTKQANSLPPFCPLHTYYMVFLR